MAILSTGGQIVVPVRTPTGTKYMSPAGTMGPTGYQGRPPDPSPIPQAEAQQGFDPNLLLVLGAVAVVVVLIMVLQ